MLLASRKADWAARRRTACHNPKQASVLAWVCHAIDLAHSDLYWLRTAWSGDGQELRQASVCLIQRFILPDALRVLRTNATIMLRLR